MRQIFLACLFVCFIFFTVVQAQTVTSEDLFKQFLNLPAPPPQNEAGSQNTKAEKTSRAPEFYDQSRIPSDDAPIEELIDYWSMQSSSYRLLRYNIKPSDRTLERILEFCEEHPDTLNEVLNVLPTKPKIAEAVKRIYDKTLPQADAETNDDNSKTNDDEAEIDEDKDYYKSEQLKQWLLYHSDVFADELLKNAEKVKDQAEYVTNQAEVLALSRVAWEKAVPILERIVDDKSQPVASTLAKWAYYQHALESEEDADISKYRRQLQDVVENRNMPPGARDLALDALVSEKEWDERDNWYLSLLSDETLHDLKVNGQSYTGLTTLILYSPPGKYVKMMAALVDSKNPTIRNAAVKNLLTAASQNNIEAIRALLPWLSNPNWISENQSERGALIVAVGKVDLPESVPGLIAILNNEEDFRMAAAKSLGSYKDSRAVPALRIVLANENNPYKRRIFIDALFECGGLSDDEQMSALEIYVTTIATSEGVEKIRNTLLDGENPKDPVPLVLSIGNFIADQTEPSDGLVARALQRLKVLRKSNPVAANVLAAIMQKWQGKAIYIERLRQIQTGEADLETILAAIAKRKEIREKLPNEVNALRGANGTARGIGACLAEDNSDFLSILGQKDANAQTAMFGCARLLRVKLPVAEVGAFLKNANKTLALAAERYLESEDSVEARTLVLAHHPDEAVILGARHAFVPDAKNPFFSPSLNEIFQSVNDRGVFNSFFPKLDKSEEIFRNEIKASPDLLAVYAFFPDETAGQQVIRVFKDKITFTNYEDAARYRDKTLSAKEYEDFYRLVINEQIDSIHGFYGYCYECSSGEFVMFGRGGGRRVFFNNGTVGSSPMKKILDRFEAFNRGELKLHYFLADKIKGLEILLATDKFTARAIWKNGADLRVLVEDKDKEEEIRNNLAEQFKAENSVENSEEDYNKRMEREQSQFERSKEAKYAHYSWQSIENGKPVGALPQPLEIPFLYDESQFPETPGVNSAPRAWQVRAGNYELRTIYSEESGDEAGLYKVSRGQKPVKFKEGKYAFQIVTADGNWVIASKLTEYWGEPSNLVRINLQTGKEFQINLPPADVFKPVAFIASQNKVLIYRARAVKPDYNRQNQTDDYEIPVQNVKTGKNPSPLTPEYYLLDAATGAAQPAKGEFRPLEQQTFRPLQPTAAPNEFWAAIYDKNLKETTIGRYNLKTFAFAPVTKLPEINLDSMDIWVDEKDAKVYFVYEGHLLAAPLQSQQNIANPR